MLGAVSLCAEVIDQIAVTVGRTVITESDVIKQIQLAAFQNGEPADLSAEAKRRAAQKLVNQVLIRREMEISRYPMPDAEEAKRLLEQFRKERFAGEDAFRAALERYGLTEEDLRQNLLLQLVTMRFIEHRFRPGVVVSDEEVERYYKNELLPKWKNGVVQPPALEDSRDQIEEILAAEKVNQALDAWLRTALRQARIRYREAVFR